MGLICVSNKPKSLKDDSKKCDLEPSAITKSKNEQITEKLKLVRDGLYDKIKFYEKNIEICQEDARFFIEKNQKSCAILAIKRKKLYTNCLEKCSAKINFIDNQIANIDMAVQEVEFLKVIKEGNAFLKEITEKYDVFEIERLASTLKENKAPSHKIESILNEYGITDAPDIENEYKEFECFTMSQIQQFNIPSNHEQQQNSNHYQDNQSHHIYYEEQKTKLFCNTMIVFKIRIMQKLLIS